MKGESSTYSNVVHMPVLEPTAPIYWGFIKEDALPARPSALLNKEINTEENTELEKVFFSIPFIDAI